MAGFVKIRFESDLRGCTAGIVMDADKAKHSSLISLSRYFPMGEARKMQRMRISPRYESFEEAFDHVFPEPSARHAAADGIQDVDW